MDICSGGNTAHEEIAFEGSDCPICALIDEKNEEINDLNEKINEQEEELEKLNDKIIELENNQKEKE